MGIGGMRESLEQLISKLDDFDSWEIRKVRSGDDKYEEHIYQCKIRHVNAKAYGIEMAIWSALDTIGQEPLHFRGEDCE